MLIDLQHFKEQGWVLVDTGIPQEQLNAVVDVINCNLHLRHDFVNGILPIHQHQALWNNRQMPELHSMFSAIHGSDELWVSIDRVSFKPQISDRANFEQGQRNSIHVDKNLQDPTFRVQGVLYLTDTEESQGAWECCPGVYEDILNGETSKQNLRSNIDMHPIHRVPGPAGSMVIWDSRMPHSSGHNWTETARYAQYITMNPTGSETERQQRIHDWRLCRIPHYFRNVKFAPDPEPWGKPATLSSLGKKLLGLRTWDSDSLDT